jgi:DNA-binding transcriptional LysR family regulator
VLAPADHPLATLPAITCRELIGQPLLMPKSGITRTRLNAWLESVEDEISISMELDSTEMIKRFVMAGLGISFLAASHCQEEVAAGKLAAIPIGPEPMIRRLGLIYRKDKALSKAALGFIQVTLAHAGDADVALPPVRVART